MGHERRHAAAIVLLVVDDPLLATPAADRGPAAAAVEAPQHVRLAVDGAEGQPADAAAIEVVRRRLAIPLPLGPLAAQQVVEERRHEDDERLEHRDIDG